MSEAKMLTGYQLAHILVRLTALVLLIQALDWAIPTIAYLMSLLFANGGVATEDLNIQIIFDMLIPALIKILTFSVLWLGSGWFSQRICPVEGEDAQAQVATDALKPAGVFITGLALIYVFAPILIRSVKGDDDSVAVTSGAVLLLSLGMILFPSAVVSGLAKIAGLIGRKRNRF
ncbi:MAG: hypothetical protein AAGC58_09425 [Asticcacaulis sp.]